MKLQKETNEHGRWYGDACGAAFAMELIGERWTILVVRELMLGGRRFSDIRARLPGISAKVLTERLERLEAVGLVTRRQLPPPTAARVYELTEWGYELEPVMQALGRWSVRSPLHDPGLPLTPVSFMLSMRTMLDAEQAAGLDLVVRFVVGEERFRGELHGGELKIARAEDGDPPAEIAFTAADAGQFLPVFYGKVDPDTPGLALRIDGDPVLVRRFIDIFRLPPKCSAPPGR